jgi:hypothetical protein
MRKQVSWLQAANGCQTVKICIDNRLKLSQRALSVFVIHPFECNLIFVSCAVFLVLRFFFFYSGRLLRAFNIDFNWYKLSSWINVTEQWPYRLSWIILEVEDNPDIEDTVLLKAVYERLLFLICFLK